MRVSHIKASSPNGPRYDGEQSASDRHSYGNLILLCAAHGDVVDKRENVATYTVERMIAIKVHHEKSCGPEPGLDATDDVVRQVIDLSGFAAGAVSINQSGGQTAHTIINYGQQSSSDVPILRWLDPTARFDSGELAVDVWCENSGPLESVAVILRRTAAMNRPDESSSWEEMWFDQFSEPSYVRSVLGGDNRRWLVKIRSFEHAAWEIGPRLVKWSVIYKDNLMVQGYMTTASLEVHFDSGSARVVSAALDATSPEVRARRYDDWIKLHGDPST